MSSTNEEVFKNWSESAGFWDKHREARRVMFGPLTPALCREAGVPDAPPSSSYRLLDVASGPGDATLDIADTLGSNATIWCTDLVPDMVRIAERTAGERGVKNVQFRVTGGESLPFDSNFFDSVVCRFGIMFFTDPVAGVREALRVLKTGRRFAYCVWGARAVNPFHRVIQDVLDRYVPAPEPDTDAPGAYRYALPGKLAAILREAGAADIRDHLFQFKIEAPISFDQFFEVRTEMSDSLRDKLRKMPADQKSSFKEDVSKEAKPYFTQNGFRFPAEVRLVSGSCAK